MRGWTTEREKDELQTRWLLKHRSTELRSSHSFTEIAKRKKNQYMQHNELLKN